METVIATIVLAAAANPFLPIVNLIVGWITDIRPAITLIALIILGVSMWAHMQSAKAVAIATAVALAVLWAAPAIATALEAAK